MTEREQLAGIVLRSGVDLMEDGVGDGRENALRIADALIEAGWSQDPGTPRTDRLAENAALHALADMIADAEANTGGQTGNAEFIAGEIRDAHTVTWERDVNNAGTPVRRYVLRGAWEVDPERSARDAKQTAEL